MSKALLTVMILLAHGAWGASLQVTNCFDAPNGGGTPLTSGSTGEEIGINVTPKDDFKLDQALVSETHFKLESFAQDDLTDGTDDGLWAELDGLAIRSVILPQGLVAKNIVMITIGDGNHQEYPYYCELVSYDGLERLRNRIILV